MKARYTRTVACALTALSAWLLAAPAAGASELRYDAQFRASFEPERGTAAVSIRIAQDAGELRSLDFRAPDSRFAEFAADGGLEVGSGRALWQVPRSGGELRYRAVIDHRRQGGYDARLTGDYAVFRLDDLFPAATARSRRGASSRSALSLAGPAGWSFEAGYGPIEGSVAFENPLRGFDRPTGWAIAGKLGIRRDIISSRRVAVAAPVGVGFRRQDTLAFLRWTLPELTAVFPDFPERLLIVGAGDPFWRGGLSGPGSLFMHSDRPLISGNATSTLLHELVHVATSSPPAEGDDWIVEGLAEYYSLEVLARSGGISERRMRGAFEALDAWAQADGGRLTDPSTGADTARAAVVFRQLAGELADAGSSLDKLAIALFEAERVDRQRLRLLAEKLLGHPSRALDAAYAELEKG